MKLTRLLMVAVLLLAGTFAYAQDAKDIVIAGQIVARVRDKGDFDSLSIRAGKVDHRISDVISDEDTQNPKLRLATDGGIPTIYVGDTKVIGVHPGDAEPQGITQRQLAAMWMKNIKLALPKATPVSRLPATPGPAPEPVVTGNPLPRVPDTDEPETPTPAPVGPSTAHAGPTPIASTDPTGDAVPTPVPSELPEPEATPRGAALLLLMDSFNSVRALTEEEYLAGRDRLAANVIANLEPFMSSARGAASASGETQPPRPITVVGPETPVTPTPVVPTPVTPTAPEVEDPPTPTIPNVPTAPATTGTTVVVPESPVDTPSGDPSYTRVPQKQHIKRKMAAAQAPYMALKAAGNPQATAVYALLKASRTAHTAGDFDLAESKVDEALRMMGVPIPD